MNRPSIFSEYKATLKNPVAEELIDLAFYRPVSFLFVKVLSVFPVTPNQISLMAMAAGIAAGGFFAWGGRGHFFAGGLFFCLSNILDCCDGMIARLKKNGTPTGRIVDGIVDYVASIAVYTGLGIGLTKACNAGLVALPLGPWLLVLIAGASTVLHSICSDYHRNNFLRRAAQETTRKDEREIFAEELQRLEAQKGHWTDKALIRIYLRYLRLQAGRDKRNKGPDIAGKAQSSPAMVVLWNLIGPSMHISAVVAAALLYRPAVFFIFVIGAANIWMLLLLMLQLRRPQVKSA